MTFVLCLSLSLSLSLSLVAFANTHTGGSLAGCSPPRRIFEECLCVYCSLAVWNKRDTDINNTCGRHNPEFCRCTQTATPMLCLLFNRSRMKVRSRVFFARGRVTIGGEWGRRVQNSNYDTFAHSVSYTFDPSCILYLDPCNAKLSPQP